MATQADITDGSELVGRGVQSESDVQYMRPVLAANQNVYAANATLREDEWERIDERVNAVFRERLTGIEDLRSRGLVQNLNIGTTLRKTERMSDISDAELTMDGDSGVEEDRISYTTEVRPVPIAASDFRYGIRDLDASRTRGEDLETTHAEQSSRKVADRLEDLLFNGQSNFGPDGNGIPGYTTATNRLTVTLSNNWDTSSGTPVEDVESMLQTAYNNNVMGPFVLYVSKNYWATIQDDYKAESEATFIDRFLRFVDIDAVRPGDKLADDNVVLVQMTRDVVDLSVAQNVTTVQWEKNPMVTKFRVWAAMGPHIKTSEQPDGTNTTGIVHLS